MNTPLADFVTTYIQSDTQRLHMPGHKGVAFLGCEARDLTEIPGADSLYDADGVIAQSEANTSALFGCPTFYSTEGSSQCIRAMLYLVTMRAKAAGYTPRILASGGAHAVFVGTAALLDIEVEWLPFGTSYLSCAVHAEDVQAAFDKKRFDAVYVTSPDYLGYTADIAAIAAVCRVRDVPLLVDNAHGAYRRFLPLSEHPMDLGATMCCDSAHKTLPALTGAAYLHIAVDAPSLFLNAAKEALSMFGSTSPSYLILQSLDLLNRYLAEDYAPQLADCIRRTAALKAALTAHGYTVCDTEPLKITLAAKPYGYRGEELAAALRERGVEAEFFDPDYLVMMITPENGPLTVAEKALMSVPRRPALTDVPPMPSAHERCLSPHEALFRPRERVATAKACGRILAVPTVGCPPAIPIVMGGERIDTNAQEAFSYYGIRTCVVITE